MIKLENVNYQYKNGEKILENINFEVQDGEIISIIGKNGNGKSTLLNLIAGILKPTAGKIVIDEIDTKSKKDFLELRKKIGIVFQNPDAQILFPSVFEDMEFVLKNLGIENHEKRILNALEIVNMKGFEKKDIYELSLGQKQRINIANVLAVKPKYILLDEPTTMIDSLEKENIYRALLKLKKEGFTIIFVTNNVNEILLSDRIFILEDKTLKYIFPKNEILDKINYLEECEIKIPDMIQILLKLKEKNVNIRLEEWSTNEMITKIVEACEK